MATHIDLPAWLQLYGQLYVTLYWQPWIPQFSLSTFAFRVTLRWLCCCILGHTTERGEVVFFSERCLLSQQLSLGQNFSSSSFVEVKTWLYNCKCTDLSTALTEILTYQTRQKRSGMAGIRFRNGAFLFLLFHIVPLRIQFNDNWMLL